MSQAKSPNAYGQRLRDIMDRALEAPNGVALPAPTWEAAFQLRQRFYGARRAEKRMLAKSSRIPEDQINIPWDALSIRVKPDDEANPKGPCKVIIETADAGLQDITLVDPITGDPVP